MSTENVDVESTDVKTDVDSGLRQSNGENNHITEKEKDDNPNDTKLESIFNQNLDTFRNTCAGMEYSLRSDNGLANHLRQAIEVTLDALRISETMPSSEDGTFTDEEHIKADHILRLSLPKWVYSLLQRGDVITSLKSVGMDLIVLFINSCIEYGIPREHIEMLMGLSRTFSHSSGFYHSSRLSSRDQPERMKKDQNNDEKATETAVSPPQFTRTDAPPAPMYVQAVEYFGRRNGFNLLLQKLESGPHLLIIKAILRVISNMRNYLSTNFVAEYVPKIQTTIFTHLLSLAVNEFKKEEKVIVAEIGDMVQNLLALVWTENKLEEAVERFNLDVAFRNFMSANLERKLRGIKYIRKVVGRAQLNSKDDKTFLGSLWKAAASATANAMNPTQQKKEEKPVDPKMVLDWLRDNDVVGCICRTTHPEVIKQSLNILIFTAKSNQIDLQYFTVLYDSILGKHESVKNTILTSIIQVVPYLNLDLTVQFF